MRWSVLIFRLTCNVKRIWWMNKWPELLCPFKYTLLFPPPISSMCVGVFQCCSYYVNWGDKTIIFACIFTSGFHFCFTDICLFYFKGILCENAKRECLKNTLAHLLLPHHLKNQLIVEAEKFIWHMMVVKLLSKSFLFCKCKE